MAVYGINYDEGMADLGYKSVYVRTNDGEEKVFSTGNFVKDWFDMMKHIITNLFEKEANFVGSSTVDHFFMDGADLLYDEAFLVTDEQGVAGLCYGNFKHMGITLYVKKGTEPTWTELKEICK